MPTPKPKAKASEGPIGPQEDAAEIEAFLAAIGAELRKHRAKRGLTRRQLAESSATSERYLAQIESGTGNPSVSVLRAIARALELPTAALLPETGVRNAALGAVIDLIEQVPDTDLPTLAKDIELRLARQSNADRGRRVALVGLRGAG
ncbi:MAG TPA: helix-turn-helix domain-containing protein, partial [Stellaceae bacterium]|nr:helix-turn-helix domain-containing protein [Stellaceae bacterium]